jgi:hypothetical protein
MRILISEIRPKRLLDLPMVASAYGELSALVEFGIRNTQKSGCGELMKYFRYIPVLLLLLCLLAVPALAATGQSIHFNGKLVSDDGRPLSGLQFLTFSIYDNADGRGDALWSGTVPVQVRQNGEYRVELGATSPGFAEKVIEGHILLYLNVGDSQVSGVSAPTVITTIPQGIWVDCNPDNSAGNCDGLSGVTSEAELKTLAAAGFRYVFNDSNLWGTQAQIAAWAKKASSSGLKIIWYIPSDFALYQSTSTGRYSLMANDTELASSFCSGCTNAAFTTALVKWFATFPATAGYYIDDELVNMASQREIQNYKGKNVSESAVERDIATLYNTVHAADPNHSVYGAETWDSVNDANESQLAGFLDPIESDLDLMGADYYPVGTGEAASTEAWAASWLDTVANNYGKSAFMNLQAFSWEDFAPEACASQSICVYPTVGQLKVMLAGAANASKAPSLLVWYDYGDTVANGQWNSLVSAANPQ